MTVILPTRRSKTVRYWRASKWRPKLTERKDQCAECPFIPGNDAEIARALQEFRSDCGLPELSASDSADAARVARILAQEDAAANGDYACQSSAIKDREFKQCPGASRHFRARCGTINTRGIHGG